MSYNYLLTVAVSLTAASINDSRINAEYPSSIDTDVGRVVDVNNLISARPRHREIVDSIAGIEPNLLNTI